MLCVLGLTQTDIFRKQHMFEMSLMQLLLFGMTTAYFFSRHIFKPFFILRFIVGNVWLFGDDAVCTNPGASPVYNLCFAMLIISYIQICLPCIIALCMIPVFCFCMPCLIRMLARLQNENAPKGASDTIINTLPLITITQRLLDDERSCRHLFHKNVSFFKN
jgi:hypothetical protein